MFVALGLPFPQVHLSVGGGGGGGGNEGGNRLPVKVANTSCGIFTGPASSFNIVHTNDRASIFSSPTEIGQLL